MTEAQHERLCLMLEAHPTVTLDAIRSAATAYRERHHEQAQAIARAEQDAGRDGRQIIRTVQWLAGIAQ